MQTCKRQRLVFVSVTLTARNWRLRAGQAAQAVAANADDGSVQHQPIKFFSPWRFHAAGTGTAQDLERNLGDKTHSLVRAEPARGCKSPQRPCSVARLLGYWRY